MRKIRISRDEKSHKIRHLKIHTVLPKSGGLETNGRRERILGHGRRVAVRGFLREARGYWASMRARKPAENVGRLRTGGAREIRTECTVMLWRGTLLLSLVIADRSRDLIRTSAQSNALPFPCRAEVCRLLSQMLSRRQKVRAGYAKCMSKLLN